MKTEAKERVNNKSEVIVNPELNKYHGKILFPKKLEIAEKQIKGLDIDKIRNLRG